MTIDNDWDENEIALWKCVDSAIKRMEEEEGEDDDLLDLWGMIDAVITAMGDANNDHAQ